MNKKFFLALCMTGLFAASISTGVNAQSRNARAGIKGGLNVSNLYINDVTDENSRLGFHVGVFGQILSNEAFAIQPELNYTTKGTQADYNSVLGSQTIRFNLNYLELPVLAVFKLGTAAEIHAGAYGGYLLHANITSEGDFGSGNETLDRDHFKATDWGLVGGFGLNLGGMQLGARYNYGLSEIADSNSARNFVGSSKNSCAQIYASFNLNQP